MKILIVEDNEDFLEGLIDYLNEELVGLEIITAASKYTAEQKINSESFDLAILDLNIPTEDNSLDPDEEHGNSVFRSLLAGKPGVPVCFLSAFVTQDHLRTLLHNHGDRDHLWGSPTLIPLVSSIDKQYIHQLFDLLRQFVALIDDLNVIEIDIGTEELQLSSQQKRIIRILCKRQHGRRARVSDLSGGLSGSRVIKAIIEDSHGAVRIHSAVKIDFIDTIDDEIHRYGEVSRLPAGSYAPKADEVKSGSDGYGGILYRLSDETNQNLYRLLLDDPENAHRISEQLRRNLSTWSQGVPAIELTVRELRRYFVDDRIVDDNRQLLTDNNIDIDDFEDNRLNAKICTQHCDLHGANVLITDDYRPIIIDYGDVGASPAARDPITLELSHLWHPSAENLRSNVNTDILERWHQLAQYSNSFQYAEYIRDLRSWAHAAAAGSREVYASVYSYALRQVKYQNTNKDFVISLMKSAINAFNSQT